MCVPLWRGTVPCLPSVTGFSSKLVFNLAKHPHYYSARAISECSTPHAELFLPNPLYYTHRRNSSITVILVVI